MTSNMQSKGTYLVMKAMEIVDLVFELESYVSVQFLISLCNYLHKEYAMTGSAQTRLQVANYLVT